MKETSETSDHLTVKTALTPLADYLLSSIKTGVFGKIYLKVKYWHLIDYNNRLIR